MGDNDYQVAQFNYRSGRWTLLDDDNGVAYVQTVYAESSAQEAPHLYSLTAEGTLFELNYRGLADPYESDTVQDELTADDQIGATRIRRPGAFNSAMTGDMMRFYSSNLAIDGVARVIRTATDDQITFDSLAGLAPGDEFVVGANRFIVRFAALRGRNRQNVKTLDGLRVVARPGTRNTSGSWPDPPDGRLTARVYRDFEPTAEHMTERTVEVFDESEVEETTLSREVPIGGAGTAVEVELECIEARTDFSIEAIEARVTESGDLIADASTEE